MTKELTIQARNNDIGKAIDFIQSALKESNVERSKAYRSTLVIEELLALMIQHAPGEEASVRIRVHNKKKYAGITITARQYIGFEAESGYHHYNVDAADYYEMEE